VRMSVANYETLVANATRRALRHKESTVAPRVSDLDAILSSTQGKVEFDTLDDGREGEILEQLIKGAVLTVFKRIVPAETHRAVVEAFDSGVIASVGEDISSADYAKLLNDIPALTPPVRAALEGSDDRESPAMVASAVELVLEGLHLSKRLNKEASGAKASYRARG